MAFGLLGHSPTLYPLYSDMENSDIENKLMVPSPIQRQRNAKSPTSRMSRNHNYYRNAQRRSNKRIPSGNNIHFTKHLPKSSSLDTMSSFSSLAAKRADSENEFIYNLTKSLNKHNEAMRNNEHHSRSNYYNMKKNRKYEQKQRQKRRQKRRIRTFYSSKWGNKLYGLTTSFPIIPSQKDEEREPERAENKNRNRNENGMNLWESSEVNIGRRSLSAFIEEENLDLNDIKSPRSISASPLIDDRLNIDFRLHENTNYDSNVSNIAATTDIDDDDDDDDDDDNQTVHRFDDFGNRSHSHSNFKIVVSAPNDINGLHSEMVSTRRNYIPSSDIESAASDDCSSSDDDDDDNLLINHRKSSLFLGGNNMHIGVYSSFPYSDQSETDYLSAQSDDFDELTICYHNARNIGFRNGDNDNYLSDIGASDIGSSDTDCFSSADSIPDSVPPQPDFVSML